jgi:hypothetical protein
MLRTYDCPERTRSFERKDRHRRVDAVCTNDAQGDAHAFRRDGVDLRVPGQKRLLRDGDEVCARIFAIQRGNRYKLDLSDRQGGWLWSRFEHALRFGYAG